MSEIVDFKPKAATEVPEPPTERKIWVCSCGCSTFTLLSDGSVECAMCEEPSHDDQGGWTMPGTATEWSGDAPVRDIAGNGSIEFAKRLILKRAEAEDAALVVVADRDGAIHTWSECETEEQFAWAGRKLDDIKALVLKRAPAETGE